MHAVFMVSGIRKYVDDFFNWLDYRFYSMPFKNPMLVPNGPKDANGNLLFQGFLPVTGKLRYGVYGTYELCFPEEYKDIVLTTLNFHHSGVENSNGEITPVKNFLANMEIEVFRKLIGCEPIPEFKTDQQLPIPEDTSQYVRIIPIGVRYDVKEWAAPNGLIHERI